jgi:hypothetical protein
LHEFWIPVELALRMGKEANQITEQIESTVKDACSC